MMEMTHKGGGKIRDRSTSMEYYNMTKRIRSGSISGRLRTASDLEECGLIDRTQKGMIKDLIISGDSGVNTALESYELGGNAGHIQELIRQGYLRRKSIDLLDGLDLDFLQVEGNDNRKVRNSSLSSLVEFFPESFDADYTLNTTDTSTLFVPDLKFDLPDTDIGADWSSLMPSRKFSMDDTLYYSEMNDHIDMSSYTQIAQSLMNEQKINKSNSTSRIKKHGAIGGGSVTKPSLKEKNTDDHYFLLNKHEGRGGGSILTLDTGHSTVHFHYTNPSGDNIPKGFIGAYSPDARRLRIERFIEKRNKRVWTKKVKYDVRKNFADSRIRVKGRFVKKEDEVNLRADPSDF